MNREIRGETQEKEEKEKELWIIIIESNNLIIIICILQPIISVELLLMTSSIDAVFAMAIMAK